MSGETAPAELLARLGETFTKRYELHGRLGSGGMASVYRGRDRELDRAVAVKIQMQNAGFSEASAERFRFEAQAGAQIRHRNVVQILDTYVEGDCWWIVCELVEGSSLNDRLSEAGGRLGALAAVRAAQQVALGLAALHERGLIHRDLKPENVLVARYGDEEIYKLSDLGLANVRDRSGVMKRPVAREFQTQPGLVLGTPGYMAPEQIHGEAGGRADLYALGTMLFRMVSGELPHEAASDMDLIRAKLRLERPPARLSEKVPEVNAELDELVSALLERDVDRRPATAALVAERLEKIAEQLARDETTAPQGVRRDALIPSPSAGRTIVSSRDAVPNDLKLEASPARATTGSRPGSGATKSIPSRGKALRSAPTLVASGRVAAPAAGRGVAAAAMALAIVLGLAAGFGWRALHRGPLGPFAAKLSAGDWQAPIRLTLPEVTGVPMKSALLRVKFGSVQGGPGIAGVSFPLGFADLSALGSPLTAETDPPDPRSYTVTVAPEEVATLREAWDAKMSELVKKAMGGGLSPEGDAAQNLVRVTSGPAPASPAAITVDAGELEARLSDRFSPSSWKQVALWLQTCATPEQQLAMYQALVRWAPAALPYASPGKMVKRKLIVQTRPAGALVSALEAVVSVRVEHIHDTDWGEPERVLGLTNAAHMGLVEAAGGNGDPTTVDGVSGEPLSKMADGIVMGISKELRNLYQARLAAQKFVCRRLTGNELADLRPAPPVSGAPNALELSLLELAQQCALRVTLPLKGAKPLEVWITNPDPIANRTTCTVPDCDAWRHTMRVTVMLPRGAVPDTDRPIGLRFGPLRAQKASTVIPYEDDGGIGLGILEAAHATMVVTKAAWVNRATD